MTLVSLLRGRALSALPDGTVRRRLAGGVFWTMLGSLLGQTAIAVGSILLARLLGQSGFGKYAILQSTIGMFSLVAGLSMGYVASKHVAESIVVDKEETGRVIGLSILMAAGAGLVVTALMAAAATPFARVFLRSEELSGALRIASPVLLFGAVSGVQRGVLAGLEQFRTQSLLITITAVITVLLTTAGAWLGDLSGAMWGSAAGAGLSVLMLHPACKRGLSRAGITVRFRGSWREKGVLWTLAFPALLSGLMVGPVVWMTNAILVNSHAGYEGMGLFNAANQWRTMLMFVPGIVLTPLLPIMCQLHATQQYHRLGRVLVKTLALSVGVVGSIAIVLSLIAERIMSMYGPGFETGANIFQLMMLVSVLLSAGLVVGTLLTSTGAMWTGLVFNGIWAVIMIGTAVLAVPRYGALGLALAYALSYLIHTAIQFLYFQVYVRNSKAPTPRPPFQEDPAEERIWG